MVKDKMELVHQSYDMFAAPHLPFPSFLTGTPASLQPQQGVLDIDPTQPSSISVVLPISHTPVMQLVPLIFPPPQVASEVHQMHASHIEHTVTANLLVDKVDEVSSKCQQVTKDCKRNTV